MVPATGTPPAVAVAPQNTPPKTPVAAKLAWDYPVARSVTVPDCKDDRIFFQNDDTWFAVKTFKQNLSVRKFENGVLKAKAPLWANEVLAVTPDGIVITKSSEWKSPGEASRVSLPPLASVAGGLLRLVSPLANRSLSSEAPGALSHFLKTGAGCDADLAVSFFGPDLKQIGKNTYLGRVGMGCCCQTDDFLYAIPTTGEQTHFIWPSFNWVSPSPPPLIRTFQHRTGTPVGSASKLLNSKPYTISPQGDRLREAWESRSDLCEYQYPLIRIRAVLYENLKLVAKASFPEVICRYAVDRPCKLGSIRLIIFTNQGEKTTEIMDGELVQLLEKTCRKQYPNLFVGDFQLERRPGGGFMILLKVLHGDMHPKTQMPAGTFFREYTADGQPAGPVRPVSFTRITRLSDTAWRAESGCSWEDHRAEVSAARP
ncbi:MAG: hypothetical protein CVU65_14220 [Deltaproteobacteria bacterium HGW-Deltaproteobacteria-22]|nr:MAG: hypothetical protein CVU65_14220 [Deltaproteobacteria bacterium HGW-Deltaproteobacteria-22]